MILQLDVIGFHADNGSEYINRRVAALLRKLHIEEFTKSRARRCNDNALVESKNASVVRRYLGYDHIPRHHAALVNDFLRDVLAGFLTNSIPCAGAQRHAASTPRRSRSR